MLVPPISALYPLNILSKCSISSVNHLTSCENSASNACCDVGFSDRCIWTCAAICCNCFAILLDLLVGSLSLDRLLRFLDGLYLLTSSMFSFQETCFSGLFVANCRSIPCQSSSASSTSKYSGREFELSTKVMSSSLKESELLEVCEEVSESLLSELELSASSDSFYPL